MVSSTESAMRSRLASDDFMPWWPMAMPSVTVMVVNSRGVPPPRHTPTSTARGRREGEGGERARRAAAAIDADLHGLGLAAERNVAGRGLVPAGRHAHDRLGDLLLIAAHGVEIRPGGCPPRAARR